MKGKKSIALIILILSIQILITTNSTAEENKKTIIVDINGNGDFLSIQQAIDNAEAGSKIIVKPGEYPEIIDIDKKITLKGENKELTFINPISNKNKYAVRLGAPGVILGGLSITNGAPGLYSQAIRITSEDTQITDCNIYNTPVGILIWTSKNIIQKCDFWNCQDEGIALIGTTHTNCKNNKIIDCKFYKNGDGIELQYSSENEIINCEIYENSHSGIKKKKKSNNENIIKNCKIYKNKVHGIYLYSSSHNKISSCVFYDNKNGDIHENENSFNNQVSSDLQQKNNEEKPKNNKFNNLLKLLEKIPNSNFINRIKNLSFFNF